MYQHAWEVSPTEAIAIQQQLRSKVITEDRLGPVHLVAGVDMGSVEGGSVPDHKFCKKITQAGSVAC
jgi:deoxyribonuclease V